MAIARGRRGAGRAGGRARRVELHRRQTRRAKEEQEWRAPPPPPAPPPAPARGRCFGAHEPPTPTSVPPAPPPGAPGSRLAVQHTQERGRGAHVVLQRLRPRPPLLAAAAEAEGRWRRATELAPAGLLAVVVGEAPQHRLLLPAAAAAAQEAVPAELRGLVAGRAGGRGRRGPA